MPLQNRVTPFGDLIAVPDRGVLFGNRGGRIHDPGTKSLSARRWASRQWIICTLSFKGRQRDVWGRSYTELFFLDEVTALAAGHRPCFECRRAAALSYAAAFDPESPGPKPSDRPRAPDIDRVLHAERLERRDKRLHRTGFGAVPDGAMVVIDGAAFAVRGDSLLPWSPAGYGAPRLRPTRGTATMLTPPASARTLAAGYQPIWHRSVADC